MTSRLGICSIGMLVVMMAAVAWAQNDQPWRTSPPATAGQPAAAPAQPQAAYPPQPYGPPSQGYAAPSQTYARPGAQPAPRQGIAGSGQFVPPPASAPQPAPGPAAPPWWNLMTAQDHAKVDRVLRAWEAYGDRVEMFESKFVRYTYEPDRNSRQPGAVIEKWKDLGVLKYKKPDKGLFEITGPRAEKYIYDGESVYIYDFTSKKVEQQVLPPGQRGQPIGDGPVPFVFGSKAAKMRDRYWMRVIREATNEVLLEAYPRHQEDRADFSRAEIILATSATEMRPVGVRRFSEGQQVRTADGQIRMLGATFETYMFYETVINPKDPLRIRQLLEGDPFTARIDRDWTKVVRPAQALSQAAQPTASVRQ